MKSARKLDEENFFLFGLTAEEVRAKRAADIIRGITTILTRICREAIDLIQSGHFSHGDTHLFKPLVDSLIKYDPYMLFADYQSYVDCQDRIGRAYKETENWVRMSILNTARMGKFSSDRAIQEYAKEIWHVKPVKVELEKHIHGDAGLRSGDSAGSSSWRSGERQKMAELLEV